MLKYLLFILACGLSFGCASKHSAEPRVSHSSLTPAAKAPDGSLKFMDHYSAAAYCSSQKARLPTAREFATLAVRSGMKIYEKSDESAGQLQGRPNTDFYFRDMTTVGDYFLYDIKDCKPLPGELGADQRTEGVPQRAFNGFWTNSLLGPHSGSAYVWQIACGFGSQSRSATNVAVVCLKD